MKHTDPDPSDKFAAALVDEIWAQMGREKVRSSRALARMIDMNHVSMNDKLGKNGTPITGGELFRICRALNIEPWEIVRRAGVAAGMPPGPTVGQRTAG